MQKNIVILSLLVISFLAACGNTPSDNSSNSPDSSQDSGKKSYSMDTITQHNSKESCWLLINNKVYDMTPFVTGHPGGDTILAGCGKDATALFATKDDRNMPHSDRATNMLEQFYVGDLN